MQQPWPSYVCNDLQPLTQISFARAAEWLRLARGGHLTYLLRHIHLQREARRRSRLRHATADQRHRCVQEQSIDRNRLLALHWMCTYIDALCAPTMDEEQEHRILVLADKASGYWYKYLPPSMHTLLVHAMLHLGQQALEYGPQCVYWLFHMERSASASQRSAIHVRLERGPAARPAVRDSLCPPPYRALCVAVCVLVPRCDAVLDGHRYIGFLTRCALSKPFPELSIINTMCSLSLATGRVSKDLARRVFGDSGQADQLAYSGGLTMRPQHLRSMPFHAVQPARRLQPHQLLRRDALNHALHHDLLQPSLRRHISSMLRRLDPAWRIDSRRFRSAVCMLGVYRHEAYEKVWDGRQDGFLSPTADWSVNERVFACAWSRDAMRPVDAHDVSVPISSASTSPHSSRSLRPSRPIYSAQRAPFEHGETIAYGLVKRWIVVEQQRVGAPGGAAAVAGDSEKLSAIIAHVRIFESTLEPDTGCPIIQQRSRPGYDDHYMLASHIVCRITVTPMPDDTSQYLLSHLV